MSDAPPKRRAPPSDPPPTGRQVTHRPYADTGGPSHLKITATTITCTRCKVVVRRAPGATLVVVEHLDTCDVVREAAA